jgi:hypothetical protein
MRESGNRHLLGDFKQWVAFKALWTKLLLLVFDTHETYRSSSASFGFLQYLFSLFPLAPQRTNR